MYGKWFKQTEKEIFFCKYHFTALKCSSVNYPPKKMLKESPVRDAKRWALK